jgi:hypothetical protein
MMGIPGAGKSVLAAELADRGYVRLNRDERGGSLRDLAAALDEQLAGGTARVVLDNTYLSRPARSYALEVAARHGVPIRCVWLDTPLDQAQVNLVERLLDHFGSLPTPEQLRAAARATPGVMLPTSQMRAVRELEPPSSDEGFASVEQVAFVRDPAPAGRPGAFVAARALEMDGFDADALSGPVLVFDWRPDGSDADLAAEVAAVAPSLPGPVEVALCPHGGGPPSCWCRPPLPGLPLAFARAHGLDLPRSAVVGTGPAHRTLARALGARYVQLTPT